MTQPASRWRRRGQTASGALFVLVFEAVPERGGATRTVLTFVAAGDVHSALRRALAELAALGWRGAELQAAKPLPADAADEPDPAARDAIVRALQSGFSLIAYG